MLNLDDYLPYLVNRLGSRIAAAYSATLRRHGITLAEWRALAVLAPAGPLTLGALARRTAIEVSTLSRVVAALARKGLATRARGDDDARAVTIAIAPSGARLVRRLTPTALGWERSALRGFRPAEAARLKASLRRAYANLEATRDAPAGTDRLPTAAATVGYSPSASKVRGRR